MDPFISITSPSQYIVATPPNALLIMRMLDMVMLIRVATIHYAEKVTRMSGRFFLLCR